jgi:hypothetical protein
MHHIRLIHWNANEAEERATRLRQAGYEVACEVPSARILREMRRAPPAAVIIDLSRLPSAGRDVALGIRRSKGTRYVPLLFVGGEQDKVARIKGLLPDAVYTTWNRIRSSLRRAIAHPPSTPAVPESGMAGYVDVPLAKKIGIKPNSIVVLVDAPDSFEKTLGKLPRGATLRRQYRGKRDMTIWFARSRKALEARVERMTPLAADGGLWIAWPKKSSSMASDLTQAIVRKLGIGAGMVDFKVCAIDATWAGLRFSHPRPR